MSFSQMNLVITKIRNKLYTTTFDAILVIRAGLKRINKCCYNYDFPSSVSNKIGTMAVYDGTVSEQLDSEDYVI